MQQRTTMMTTDKTLLLFFFFFFLLFVLFLYVVVVRSPPWKAWYRLLETETSFVTTITKHTWKYTLPQTLGHGYYCFTYISRGGVLSVEAETSVGAQQVCADCPGRYATNDERPLASGGEGWDRWAYTGMDDASSRAVLARIPCCQGQSRFFYNLSYA